MRAWIKTFLQGLLVSRACLRTTVLKRGALPAGQRRLQVILPHRLNWPLTSAAIRAYLRLTTGERPGVTLVVNFDEVPQAWEGWQIPNLTIVRNEFSWLGKILRRVFRSENGSMFNALALHRGLGAEPGFDWAFIAHSDSAPLVRGWNEHFEAGLRGGLVCGNFRDAIRVHAAHSSGTLFRQSEFLRRGGSVWPKYRFGRMLWDVSDGITVALHPAASGPVPVLPNTLQEPELINRLEGTSIGEFARGGSQVSFDTNRRVPVFAHMGRGTPRSQNDTKFAGLLPVDAWIKTIDSIS